MKRLLNIKDREKVESGEYKVFTRNGETARVICWDTKGADFPIIALVMCDDGSEIIKTYTEKGENVRGWGCASDLFVEIPDEKIPFDMKYRNDIANRRVKVQTERGEDVRIISFDGSTLFPVVGVVSDGREDYVACWTATGIYSTWGETESDLVIIKSE